MDYSQENEELLSFFFAELKEQLETLEQGILKLEHDGQDEELIQTVFRASHNIKGSSAAMGLELIKELAHEMENVLDKVRKKTLLVTHEVVDTLFQCVDYFHQLKEYYEATSETSVDISVIVNALLAIQEQSASGSVPVVPSSVANENSSSQAFVLEKEDVEALRKQQQEGEEVWICTINIDEESAMKEVRIQIIYNQLAQVSSYQVKDVHIKEEKHEGDNEFSFIIASSVEKEDLHMFLADLMDVVDVSIEEFALPSMQEEKKEEVKIQPVNETATSVKAPTHKKPTQTIRVDIDRLEMMMNLVGEIIIDQTRISQIGGMLRDTPSDDLLDEFEQTNIHMSKVVSELQEHVMKTRMLPIEQLFNRFPRIVRDVSQKLGKEMELVMEGGETELDRNVIEEISDPMIHIIRNSMDHGLETPEIRKAVGKPEKGTVTISAKHENNQVILVVEDDGAGIDAEKIGQSALAKGIVTQEKLDTMSPKDITNFVFHSGFSTAQKVSDISGRGVGMDIVRTQIEKLNGTIDIETEKGVGTKMIIKLPLTLAIVKGLLVELNKRIYSIPTNSVIEIVRVKKPDIHLVNGQEVVNIRDSVLPLIWLHDYFHFNREEESDKHITVVIIGLAEKRIGLVVDNLIGNQEIVVKSLGSYIGKIEGISGATILGNGGVALILDILSVFDMTSEERSD